MCRRLILLCFAAVLLRVLTALQESDSDGVRDDELARRAWDNYRLRNDSHIVDHFQGLYKSTLVCPQCSYSSIKFDPFMYLSLPLPESKVRQLTAILLHADGAAPPREYGLEVPQTGAAELGRGLCALLFVCVLHCQTQNKSTQRPC
jgi:hypothetical protein